MTESQFEFQMSKDEAIAFAESRIWQKWTKAQLAVFQLYQQKLCIPIHVFHDAIEETLGRPVWTHEFAFPELLKAELRTKKAPSFEEIVSLIPKEKLLIFEKVENDTERTD